MGSCTSKANGHDVVRESNLTAFPGAPEKTLLVGRGNIEQRDAKSKLLLDGYREGDAVYFKGVSASFPSGNKLVYGNRGVVVGPAKLEQLADRGLQVKFPGNVCAVDCALRSLSRSKPAPQDSLATRDAKPADVNDCAVSSTLLAPVAKNFADALHCIGNNDSSDNAGDIDRAMLLQGLDEFVIVLDRVSGGKLGSYLAGNVAKLRNAKADSKLNGYKAWLLSELPVHVQAGTGGYVDKSAWMANLWISWTLEFFVELFAQLESGKDTKQAVDIAYKQTLQKQHNMFQRATFTAAMKQLPSREQMLQSLQGDSGASPSDVLRDISIFVPAGRALVRLGLQVNEELDNLLKSHRGSSK